MFGRGLGLPSCHLCVHACVCVCVCVCGGGAFVYDLLCIGLQDITLNFGWKTAHNWRDLDLQCS